MGQKTLILAIAVIIFTVILSALLIISRINSGSKKSEPVNETPSEVVVRDVVSVTDIVNDPMVYVGYNLEVDSQITGWATNRSFFFTGGAVNTFGGGPKRKLLIIAKEPFQLPQNPDDDKLGLGETAKVTVKGTIQVVNQQQLEALLGIDLSTSDQSTSSAKLYDSTLTNWTVGPVLILETVEIDSPTK